MWRSLTSIQNSTLPWYLPEDRARHVWWEKLTNFSRGRVCKPDEVTHREFGTTSPQFSRKWDPNISVECRRSRTGSNCGRSFCIQCSVDSKDSSPSWGFSRLKELGLIHTGKKCYMEQEISGISKFPEKSWARSIRPKIPVWISETGFVCRTEQYFPPGRTDLALFPLQHTKNYSTKYWRIAMKWLS